MVEFVNIKTKQFYEFESWQKIIELGGLKAIFGNDYDDVYNRKCCFFKTDEISQQVVGLYDKRNYAKQKKQQSNKKLYQKLKAQGLTDAEIAESYVFTNNQQAMQLQYMYVLQIQAPAKANMVQ